MTTSSRIFDVVQAMSGQKNVIIIPRPYLQFFGEDQQAYQLAAVLNQLVFWSGCGGRDDGWFYKTHEELGEEVALGRDQIRRIVTKLESKYLVGVLDTANRRLNNGDKVKHYRLDGNKLIELIFPVKENACPPNGNGESAEPEQHIRHSETAEVPFDGNGEGAVPILYTDLNTDPNSQIIKPIGQPQAADPQQVDSLKIDYNAVLEAFHTTLPEMPAVIKMTDSRRKSLRKLWKDYDLTIEKWGAYLRYIAKHCRWMLEDRPDNTAGKTWRKKHFDYLITEKCYLSVKEFRANDLPKVARVDNTERDAAFVRLVAQGKKPNGRIEELAKSAAGKAGLGRMNEVMARVSWKSIWLQAVAQASEEDLMKVAS
ncbi:hypothetical protein OH773_13270 [Buttiauxella sp. WJP83]|uniref:hypothetical protein n=1 Tax=Buttiauxella sp. WJP83 TaxID=2986951 RepID=UPI0022DE8E02|nr:hypothetical protein [Buttiauxella sp. WJP83]WBM69155.1 hypothetical protein OH773_13270 [Buttiauxella sp. WJP83]